MGTLHLPKSKKNAKSEGAVIVFEDEASFRQTPTLHATWARRGSQPQIPTRGERNTQKIFGAVRLDNSHFIYLHQQDYFQWETYLAFLEQVVVPAFYRRRHRIYLIQDTKSVSDIFSPVDGEVIEANPEIEDDPGLVNSDPYGAGWLLRIRLADDGPDPDSLLTAEEYAALIKVAE